MSRLGDLLSVGKRWSEDASFNDNGLDDLRVVAFHDPPYVSMEKAANGTYVYSGYLYDVWKLLAETLNIQYRMVPPVRWGYGHVHTNGTWSGMVGELVYGRADMALTWLLNRPDRATVVDYVYFPIEENNDEFHIVGGSYDIRPTVAQMVKSLLKPLHVHVWWALLASLLIISVTLRVTMYFNKGCAESNETAAEMTFGSCLFYNYMSLVGQGWDVVPSSLAARIVIIFSWAISVIIVNSYTANLISDLTVVSVDRPISSLREFTEQPGWKLAMQPGYGVVNDWQTSPDVYQRELYRRTANHDGIIDLDDATSFRLSIEPKVMTFIDIRILKFALGSDACSLVPLLDETRQMTPNYFVVAKGQPVLRRLMHDALMKMAESGLMGRLKHKWFDRINNMCQRSSDVKAISLGNTLASLVLVPLGVALGLVVVSLECLWARAAIRRYVIAGKRAS